jgi:F-type H+-transporting ATPase subunit epsilon
MGDSIKLEIVTPRGRALAADVDEVTAPSVEGEFGVLPGHVPVLAALRTGIVAYRRGSENHRCAVGTGFAEAGPDRLVILTTEYAERDQIDPVMVRKELAEVQQQLGKLESALIVGTDTRDADAAAVEARLQRDALIARENWLATELDLYGDPLPATQRPYDEYGAPPPPGDDDTYQGAEDAPRAGATG